MEKTKLNLGKRVETAGFDNNFWIKKYENGVKIRKKGQGELTLWADDVYEMRHFLRKFGKKFNFSILLNSIDMTYVWQKYPETKEFIERLLADEVSDEEKIKIHENYMRKVDIIKSLEEK